LTLRPHWEPPQNIPVAVGEGSHGGGDIRMLDSLFGGGDDGIRPDHNDGAYALLTGLAANKSMETGAPVVVDTLLHD
jgi:hypothetical protein